MPKKVLVKENYEVISTLQNSENYLSPIASLKVPQDN